MNQLYPIIRRVRKPLLPEEDVAEIDEASAAPEPMSEENPAEDAEVATPVNPEREIQPSQSLLTSAATNQTSGQEDSCEY